MDFINIFETIVLSSLIGSLIVLMILIIKGIFKNKLNCTFHYYIWIILLIKLIVPFGPKTSLNLSNMYEKFNLQNTVNDTQIKSPQQLENTDLDTLVSISTFQPSNQNVISKAINIPSKNKVNIENALCFVWIFGVVLLIGIIAAGHKRLREIIRASIKDIDSTHKEILYNCMNSMNITTKLEILYSPKISTPSLCGFIKPKILIPVSIADNVSDEEFKYIIMHELSHLKNKDIILNWVITSLSVIYWFNPILLYGFHKMKQDCEFSCDGQVISRLSEGENLQYGNAIIRVLELGGNSRRLIGTTSMVMNSSEIKRRIIMISKYKKINIKSVLLGVIIIIIIGGLGIAVNINSYKNSSKAAASQVEASAEANKSTVNNTSDGNLLASIKALPKDNTKPLEPFSADIVIYNSHPDEAYLSGIKVTDVAALINDKLVKEGIKSRFIPCPVPKEYIKSYQSTRDLITKNVKNYSNTILLDIHRDAGDKYNDKILFVLAKSSPHYETNQKFADLLSANIKSSKQIETYTVFYDKGSSYFNQDLSSKSAFIELGNDKSTDADVEKYVDALVLTLKNIQKGSSN